ncbi:hypothetical protein O181_088124 [Austropuccinia psidii MF-1]|uniref:Uncharacterized protein n=1 Tax=Austropuccinia psidii MF-1 TaxID=1389203 RepID=A0A9Q3IR27_9BASI|nr:hypothetical protein [Austropuccinia psidii MF-1]
MVNTTNRSHNSIKQDLSAQGRGKNKARPGRPSSRKAHLEDARVASHSPRSIPKSCDINYEPEMIKVNVLRVEPLPSGSHRHISISVQKLVQRRQGRRRGNLSKPLAGGHELLFSHQELSGSGEYHRTLRMSGAVYDGALRIVYKTQNMTVEW